jgi:hypothetical protein
MELAIDASNSSSSSSTGTSDIVSPCRVKTASNSTLTIACGSEDDGTEDGVADDCASPLAEDGIVGLSDPPKLGLVTGLARIWSEEAVGTRGRSFGEKLSSAGYLPLIEVTFLKPGSLVSSEELLLCCIIATALMEVVAATAEMTTIAVVIWAAIDIPPFLAVAAAAIVPAPVAADVPADAAALTAIDWRVELKLIEWRVELKLCERTLDATIVW